MPNIRVAHLDELVPSGRDDDRVLGVRAEADAGDPVLVTLLGDRELAVTKSVPQLDGAVAGSRNDLSVVGRERDRQNIVGVSNKTAGGGSGSKLPQAEGLVPGGGESVGTIRRDNLQNTSAHSSCRNCNCEGNCARARGGEARATYTVGNDVRVTVERALGGSVGGLVAGQVPDDQRLVAGSRQEHVGVLERSRKRSDPTAVALKGALENESFRHDC